ncbi:MAG: D-3-phosphoglycerate dehydrogenase / 2-oxoglutarate reductase [Variibacter sp.]|nr:D-3-phosphoglycerate dehydrogenase / 2-oxoglutarate reductase [Variibacter sp.]
MTANKKRVLAPHVMSRAGWEILESRDDVEAIRYAPNMPTPEFHALLNEADGVALSLTPYRAQELAVSPRMRVVARIGVGYDSVEVPPLTAKKIPLMVAGTANSVSVAEQAFSMMFHLAKLNSQHDAAVRSGTWRDQMKAFPVDFYGKTLLVIGFGRIGSRTTKRGVAFEMRTLVYDPYVDAKEIKAVGAEPVTDLDAAVREADFITIHCPKNSETTDLFDARRLALMKPAAYIVNTARGGIINELALHEALANGKIAGAGIDVFEKEPAPIDHPLLKLSNVVVAPHMAGVTRESMDRMAINTVRNILSVLDGQPIRENAVNPEVFG